MQSYLPGLLNISYLRLKYLATFKLSSSITKLKVTLILLLIFKTIIPIIFTRTGCAVIS